MPEIVVVLAANLHWVPFYARYETMLRESGRSFDVLIWNREGLPESIHADRVIEFKAPDSANDKNPLKAFKFILFARFLCRTIRDNDYKKIVFAGNQAAMVPLMTFFLSRRFDKAYWYDYRDYEYEWLPLYAILQKRGIEHSYATAISSRGYLEYLPKHDYEYVHNIDPALAPACSGFQKEPGDAIRISFIGNVRYFEENVRLLRALGNDSRFMLQYFGQGGEALQDFCRKEHIRNVLFHGRFPQPETLNFYRRTDIINNIYGNRDRGLATALSNKLYYAAALGLPILVCPDTYMETVTKAYGFGFAEDVGVPGYADRLYSWYRSGAVATDGFSRFWNEALAEDAAFEAKFRTFLEA